MQELPSKFTIRVYGLLVKNNAILLSRENIFGQIFTKFPGGGLEFGEGVVDCLKREFMEEAKLKLSSCEHFYTTEGYFPSAFDTTVQVLSLYYRVNSGDWRDIVTKDPNRQDLLKDSGDQVFYWCPLTTLKDEDVQLPIDKIVVDRLLNR